MGKKTITIDLNYHGDGTIVQKGTGIYSGGVVDPVLNKNIDFTVHRQTIDEDGQLNPEFGKKSEKGSFQINISGNSEGYRELGRYFLALSELDVSLDPDYHDHFEDLNSYDQRTNLEVIIRKNA